MFFILYTGEHCKIRHHRAVNPQIAHCICTPVENETEQLPCSTKARYQDLGICKRKALNKVESTDEETFLSCCTDYNYGNRKCTCSAPSSLLSGGVEVEKSTEICTSDETILIDEEDSRNSSSVDHILNSTYFNFDYIPVTTSSENYATLNASGIHGLSSARTHSTVPLASSHAMQLSAFQLHGKARQRPTLTTLANLKEDTEPPQVQNSSEESRDSSVCISESKFAHGHSFEIIDDGGDCFSDEWQCSSLVSSEVSFTTNILRYN